MTTTAWTSPWDPPWGVWRPAGTLRRTGAVPGARWGTSWWTESSSLPGINTTNEHQPTKQLTNQQPKTKPLSTRVTIVSRYPAPPKSSASSAFDGNASDKPEGKVGSSAVAGANGGTEEREGSDAAKQEEDDAAFFESLKSIPRRRWAHIYCKPTALTYAFDFRPSHSQPPCNSPFLTPFSGTHQRPVSSHRN